MWAEGRLPLQNTDQNIARGPEIAAVPSGPPKSQCLLLPGELEVSGSIEIKHSDQDKINKPGICSLCLFQDVKEKASLETSVDTTRHEVFTSGPGYGLTPFPLNPEIFHILSRSHGNQ